MGKVNQLLQEQQEKAIERWLEEHPGATEEEAWEAIHEQELHDE